MTTTAIRPDGLMRDLIEEAQRPEGHERTLHHEDGSVTVVAYDPFGYETDFGDIQHWVSRLVSETPNYNPLHDADDGIVAIAEKAETLDYLSNDWTLVEHRDFALSGDAWDPELFLEVRTHGGYMEYINLEDEDDVRLAAAYFLGLSAAEMIQKYVDEERPDIAYYHPEWSVRGSSQSDYRDGWGYVLVSDMIETGESHPDTHPETMRERARSMFKAELKVYRQWFAGETYMATHIMPAGEEFVIGEQGGYFTGEMLGAVDTCYGFLGYDDLKDIGDQFTDSPVVREEW